MKRNRRGTTTDLTVKDCGLGANLAVFFPVRDGKEVSTRDGGNILPKVSQRHLFKHFARLGESK